MVTRPPLAAVRAFAATVCLGGRLQPGERRPVGLGPERCCPRPRLLPAPRGHVLSECIEVGVAAAKILQCIMPASHFLRLATALKPPAKWEAHDYYLRPSETYLSFLSTYAAPRSSTRHANFWRNPCQ